MPGEPLTQKTVYTVPAERLHGFLTNPRWQVMSDMDVGPATLEQRLENTHALQQGMMQELRTGRTCLV